MKQKDQMLIIDHWALEYKGLLIHLPEMRIPFTSEKAKQVNKDIFETIYHGALTASFDSQRKKRKLMNLVVTSSSC